jgi:hypothetical protein
LCETAGKGFRARKEALTQIQYLGFQLKPRGRDYLYRVVNPKSENRDFTYTIPNQAFAEKRVLYQDAAGLCYEKLRKELGLETAEQPLPRHATLSNTELDEYLEKHRPARKRT